MLQKHNMMKLDEMISDKKIPLRLAFLKHGTSPAVISLWYEIIDGKIYCATQQTAKIVSYLQKNPVCGFEIASDKPPYKGVRGEGIVKILEKQGPDILNILIDKYLGNEKSGLSRLLQQNSHSEVAIEISPKKIFHYDYSKRMHGVVI